MTTAYKYDIGISYASEQRDYVRKLERSLNKQGFICFVDYNEPERLWGEYLPEELRKIFVEECRIILVVLSAEYTQKDYTRFESRIACERELSGDSFLIIKTGDVTLPWLNSAYGYISASKYSPEQIAVKLKKKFQGTMPR